MERIIQLTADDLGWSEQANLAIEHAHRAGALTAASLMMGQPGTAHALKVIRRNPTLMIGWHFHACDSRPLTCARWPWGTSAIRAGLALALAAQARNLIRKEMASQWDEFRAAQIPCRFLNAHHHLHIHPFIARELHVLVGDTFHGWVRGFGIEFFGGLRPARPSAGYRLLSRGAKRWLRSWPRDRQSRTLWGLDRTFRMNADEVRRAAASLGPGHHEFLFHPRHNHDLDHRALLDLKAWKADDNAPDP